MRSHLVLLLNTSKIELDSIVKAVKDIEQANDSIDINPDMVKAIDSETSAKDRKVAYLGGGVLSVTRYLQTNPAEY